MHPMYSTSNSGWAKTGTEGKNFTWNEPAKLLGSSLNRKYKYHLQKYPDNAWNTLWFNSLNRASSDTALVKGGKGWKAQDGCAEAGVVQSIFTLSNWSTLPLTRYTDVRRHPCLISSSSPSHSHCVTTAPHSSVVQMCKMPQATHNRKVKSIRDKWVSRHCRDR